MVLCGGSCRGIHGREQAVREARIQDTPAGQDISDRLAQRAGRRIEQQGALCSLLYGTDQFVRSVAMSNCDDESIWPGLLNHADGCRSVEFAVETTMGEADDHDVRRRTGVGI